MPFNYFLSIPNAAEKERLTSIAHLLCTGLFVSLLCTGIKLLFIGHVFHLSIGTRLPKHHTSPYTEDHIGRRTAEKYNVPSQPSAPTTDRMPDGCLHTCAKGSEKCTQLMHSIATHNVNIIMKLMIEAIIALFLKILDDNETFCQRLKMYFRNQFRNEFFVSKDCCWL